MNSQTGKGEGFPARIIRHDVCLAVAERREKREERINVVKGDLFYLAYE